VINQRLFDWHGIDTNKDLGMTTFCPRPFDTVLIDSQGSCFLCECAGWLPQSVGNLHTAELEQLLSGAMANTLRNSIQDGSYRYCNNARCSWLLDKRPETKVWPTKVPPVSITNIRLAHDESCNLACPSCRSHRVAITRGKALSRKLQLNDRIIRFIAQQDHDVRVHIGSDGDPFASLVYRQFMHRSMSLPRVRYSLQTNGLLTRKLYARFRDVFHRMTEVGVSVDGATKDTYERLRLGGRHSVIMDNLRFIGELKHRHGFRYVIHFVTQAANHGEMPQMAELARDVGADKIWFNRITDWNTMPDFVAHDVADPDHPEHAQFQHSMERLKKVADQMPHRFVEFPTLDNL